jgi:dUTP pyrophosphatase
MKLKLLDPNITPKYHTSGAAAFDVQSVEPTFTLYPGEQRKVRLGFQVAIPPGYAGLLMPRSGMAGKLRVRFGNGVGLIDPDYRGEVCAMLHHYTEPGSKCVTIQQYARIGQLLVVPALRPELEIVDTLDDTERGDGGFGHTGQ